MPPKKIDKYVSEVQKTLKRRKLNDTQITKLLKEHHEVAFDLIFTFETHPQERTLMFFPEDITEDTFLNLIFNELGNSARDLIKISCCQLYCSKGMKIIKFSMDRNGKYYFNVDVNPDTDTRRLNKLRLTFIETLKKRNKKKGGNNNSDKVKSLEDLYWDYVENPPTKKIIIQRYNEVYQKVLNKAEDPMDFRITPKIIKYIYRKIDQVFFSGLIAPYLERKFGVDLHCGIASKVRTSAGWFSFGDDNRTPTMMIADKVFAKFFSNGEKSISNGGYIETGRLGFLVRTIEHELCHLLVRTFDYANSAVNGGHGQAFRTFILHTFGHTDYHHSGFSGDTDIAEKMRSELRVGNLVEYHEKGKKATGKIIKLSTKGAWIHGSPNGIAYGNITKIIDSGTEPVPLAINISKVKIGQELVIQKKTKQIHCTLIGFTKTRAKVEFNDKQYSAPWEILSLP